MNDCILLWPWDDAPEEYRQLSTNGGDEDRVAFVPEKFRKSWLPVSPNEWLDIDEYEVEGGVIRIGVHA